MATGMYTPTNVTPSGNSYILEGSDLLRQNILYAIRPASSRHPWNQKLTPPDTLIFDLNDTSNGHMLEAFVRDLFAEYEKLGIASLRSFKLNNANAEKGELDVIIVYNDLEDDQNREIKFTTRGRR